ncbi:MAG: hypothetical protein ACLP59_23235 [Bryobacteraceae bacterium]
MAAAERTIEDRLREEYFALLPEISRVAERLEAEIRYLMLPISGGLRRHERLAVKCRVKSCESALDKPEAPGDKGFRHKPVRDLYAYKLERPCRRSRSRVPAKPAGGSRSVYYAGPSPPGSPILSKPTAKFRHPSIAATAKQAIVSMLTGLFWEVEHSAIYKPDPRLNGIAEDRGMRERTTDVVNALRAFEEQFEALARQD